RFDVREMRPDVLCVDAYKWLLSPNGAGFLYIAPELRRRLPATVIGWRSDRNWRQVDALKHGQPIFAEAAEKYEGGMLPFACLYGMGAALEMLLDLEPERIESRVLDLAEKTRAVLRDAGGEVNRDASQIVTACLPGRDSAALAARLRESGIIISARHGRLRISPHFYNDERDLETLRAALRGQ